MDTTTHKTRDLRKEFSELPFESKVATLVEFEILTVSEGFDLVVDTTAAWAKKVFDAVMPEDCSAHQAQAESTTAPAND